MFFMPLLWRILIISLILCLHSTCNTKLLLLYFIDSIYSILGVNHHICTVSLYCNVLSAVFVSSCLFNSEEGSHDRKHILSAVFLSLPFWRRLISSSHDQKHDCMNPVCFSILIICIFMFFTNIFHLFSTLALCCACSLHYFCSV